ncbi:hypothetical protein ACFDTO_13300 [Microbacteriaceae bacterium 4G12]
MMQQSLLQNIPELQNVTPIEKGFSHDEKYKVVLFSRNISTPFAIGQVHGYFNVEPQSEFWKLYSLYAAMTFVSDIVWSYKNTPNHLHETAQRLQTILDDHQGFTTYIPSWYKV